MKRTRAALSAAAVAVSAVALVLALETLGTAEVPPRTAESVNEFAFDFYRNVSGNGKNVFFSPVSVYTAFSVLYEGARGETAEQMLGVFGFEPDDEERHSASANMMAALNAQDPRAVLKTANALWMSDWSESYLDVVRRAYLVEDKTYPIEADEFYFGDPKPVWGEINDWASEKTGGKIAPRSTIALACSGLLSIVENVVYFEGTWLVQFKQDARDGQFWRGEAGSVDADFMHAEGSFGYADAPNAQVLQMPYEGDRLSMIVVLPHEATLLGNLEATGSAAQMAEWIGMLEPRNISVSLPKFQISVSQSVNPYITKDKYDDGSIFPHLNGFNEGGCYLEWAAHSALLIVNEKGTETALDAAAMSVTGSEPPPPLHFNANRPFLFAIYDEQSGMVLFMGRVSDPTASTFETGDNMDDAGQAHDSPSSSIPPDEENDGPEIEVLSSDVEAAGSIQLAAGQQTSLDVRVLDPDGDAVTITAYADTFPGYAISVADGGDGTATVMLDAASVPAGTYVFWMSASDGKESEREPFTVVVQ